MSLLILSEMQDTMSMENIIYTPMEKRQIITKMPDHLSRIHTTHMMYLHSMLQIKTMTYTLQREDIFTLILHTILITQVIIMTMTTPITMKVSKLILYITTVI